MCNLSYKRAIKHVVPSYRLFKGHSDWAKRRLDDPLITKDERNQNAHDNEVYHAKFIAQCELVARIFAWNDMDAFTVSKDVKEAYGKEA